MDVRLARLLQLKPGTLGGRGAGRKATRNSGTLRASGCPSWLDKPKGLSCKTDRRLKPFAAASSCLSQAPQPDTSFHDCRARPSGKGHSETCSSLHPANAGRARCASDHRLSPGPNTGSAFRSDASLPSAAFRRAAQLGIAADGLVARLRLPLAPAAERHYRWADDG